MAFLGETFSTDELPVSDRSYDLIPEGWYNVSITKADLSQTKSGTGTKIDMRYDITGPSHEGRVVFGSINIRNQSQKAEEIGRQQLGEIMRAIGLAKVEDTDQLIGGQIQIKIKIYCNLARPLRPWASRILSTLLDLALPAHAAFPLPPPTPPVSFCKKQRAAF